MRSNLFKSKDKILLVVYRILTVILILFWSVLSSIVLLSGTFQRYLYPITYKEEVLEFSDKYGVDKYLVFAVIKVESGFDKNANSDKNAKGLMQITEKTARYIADNLKIEEFDLFDAKTNVEFGCWYLKYLINKFTDIDTAICAYNAGEGNVNKWLSNTQYSDDKIRLQNIPFGETREYLKKIRKTFSKYQKIYENLLDK